MSRTVVVTGAGSGIGRAIANTLAQRNWRVIVTDVNADAAREVAESLPGQSAGHEAVQLDVTSPDAAAAVAADVAGRFGLDAWVSNAGISFMHRFLEAPVERFDQTIDVNLKGVFVCGQAAAREMVSSGQPGTIVNTASMAGKQGRVPFLADYVASKFGVVGLTQAMAYELGEHGITVNCVCPGFVETPMQSRELEWEAELRGTTPEGVRSMMIADTPLGRLEQADDVARAVAFLLSDDARFITGEALAVNGGAYMD
ncbi:3-ketoacyl-ACP reductase [Mycolicibacterium parafortuitum]|uniref:3-ketoacyl-ACP reductase n=1 Tax=Mycolicibacterium parafortuitum TaxID=39692 RepID=A0A7I7U9L6_MYCPF|nr:SDR family NAD(P)-dependent oxidoreductase [Mycolicibacterium parafortuitum]PQE02020.1 3-ketoacyl-ACP reductase [Mycobacterium sp. EPG1]BBY77681.1 3-ketoacyl-ACP reductase [Mycolicibacterium parafortuitum]